MALLPYLNIEELLENGSILRLLHYRAIHAPPEFTHLDHAVAGYGRASGLIGKRFSSCYFGITQDVYGMVLPFHKEAFHSMHMTGFSNAELIFEAQDILYEFLKNFAHHLDTASGKGDGHEEWDASAKDEFVGSEALDSQLKDSFGPPSRANLNNEVVQVAAQQKRLAEAELHDLQTNLETVVDRIKIYNTSFVMNLTSEEKYLQMSYEFWTTRLMRARRWDRIQ